MNKKLSYILGAIFLTLTFSTFIYSGAVSAQPPCDWDCINTDCCSPGYEFMCNGGTYGGLCPTACIGPSHMEAPIGMCPF